MTITLGSLFDGIGVFPLVASRHGITPVWASEIIPDAISITKRHFPEMVHLGDITKLDGRKIPAVHVITFGSPCQNMSSIGPRDGLTGAKSSLFYQAIRIIEEMRDASGGLSKPADRCCTTGHWFHGQSPENQTQWHKTNRRCHSLQTALQRNNRSSAGSVFFAKSYPRPVLPV